MTSLLSRIREDLYGFTGYSSAAKESASQTPAIKIDANESPWPPFGAIGSLCDINRYPAPQPLELRARLAALWRLQPEEILITCGSDQSIDLLLRLFCMAGRDSIVVCPPTFSMYEVYAKLQRADVKYVPLLPDGQLDLARIVAAVDDNTKLIFIPSPNAPLGHLIAQETLVSLCKVLEGRCGVVVDEAYVPFSDTPDGMVPFRHELDNLIVLRTLSKAHALAGERVGATIAPAELINSLTGVIPPYPIAKSAICAANDAVSPVGLAQSMQQWEVIKQERAFLSSQLEKAERVVRVRPSQANFIFVETTDAKAFLAELTKFSIQARNLDAVVPGGVRLSVSSPSDNDLVLQALGVKVDRKVHSERRGKTQRKTKETSIEVVVDLDASEPVGIETGIAFLDHMLHQVATHGGFALSMQAKGDLHIDNHHTIEDCALAFGEALRGALGDKHGIARFGFTAPLDEAIAQVVLDLSGRPYAKISLVGPPIASDGMGLDLAEHFFRSFATSMMATLHVSAKGDNTHHVIEASFKALGRALRQAVALEGNGLPSTKGML